MGSLYRSLEETAWLHRFSRRRRCLRERCKQSAEEGSAFCKKHSAPAPRKDITDFQPGMTYIYAIECGDFVKIGKSAAPSKRISEIRTSNPLEVNFLGDVHAHEMVEKMIHSHLSDDRERGEWFRKTERVMGIVSLIAGKKAVDLWEAIGGPPIDKATGCLLTKKTK